MKIFLLVIFLCMILVTQLSFSQTTSHPSKYLLEENDLGSDWKFSIIQIPPIPDELISDGVKENAYQDIGYLSKDDQILFHGGLRVIEFSTFDNANSYFLQFSENSGEIFSKPNSSFLNQNANCMFSQLDFIESSVIEELNYLLCLKFPHLIQITLQQNLQLENFESELLPNVNELIEQVGEKVIEKLSTPSEVSINESKIPEWVKNTMKWYVEGKVSEDEMINALQFLIKEGIIKF